MGAMDLSKAVSEIMATGLTQQQVAEKIGITQATISRILTKEITNPSYKTANAILRFHSELKDRAA